ncbi:cilia- and flagella-associated protein 90 isoform X2 [Pseudophryne corroboree]|uniref:cilia- and flagella-associated protein 90 isoform X2 n=1 Tax=Pseudophryne corroboree TaxID=495146 RepID=UPI0030821993
MDHQIWAQVTFSRVFPDTANLLVKACGDSDLLLNLGERQKLENTEVSVSSEEYIPTYDAIFKRPQDYDEKLHRDDRRFAKHNSLDHHTEEISRPVPVLSSSIYGRHLQHHIDKVNRDHVRIGLVRLDFYRKNGISKSVDEGYGSVVPS